MDTELERLTGSPVARRGAVVILPQRRSPDQGKSNLEYSVSTADTRQQHKFDAIASYDTDDDKTEEPSTETSNQHSSDTISGNNLKHHSLSKLANFIRKRSKSKSHGSDSDDIGGGHSMHNDNGMDDSSSTGSGCSNIKCSLPTLSADAAHKHHNRFDLRIDYTQFQWTLVIMFTLLAVLDRFTLNVWPLWVDSPGPTIPNNFSVSIFALIAWISGRMMLVSSSYLFFTQNNVFWNWFTEQRLVNKYIKIGDIHTQNINLHYHIGWLFCGVPVLLHVWSILFAAVFPQNSIVLYHKWMRPYDANGISIPFYADNLLSLGINDVYRLVSTSVSFLVLFPYSVVACCRNNNWSFAQWVHLLGATLYTADLIRMSSHPHCWVFNVPFVIWWIFDRLYGIFYYRRCVANIVKKIHLDDNYIILYLRIPNHLYEKRKLGDIFYFNGLSCSWDRAHPFTVFWNHKNLNKMLTNPKEQLSPNWSGHKFTIYNKKHNKENSVSSQSRSQYVMSRKSTMSEMSKIVSFDAIARGLFQSDNEELSVHREIYEDYDWNVGIIVQVIDDHTDCYYRNTWTRRIFKCDIRFLCGLRAFGPYRSEYRLLIKQANARKYPLTPLVLIGTGAGCSMLLDFYHYVTNHKIELHEYVVLHFSTRSIAMFQWFTDITCHENINNLFVNAHLTSHANIMYNKKDKRPPKSRDSKIGRLNIYQILNSDTSKNTNVYFCGAPTVQTMVGLLCNELSLNFHAGHSF